MATKAKDVIQDATTGSEAFLSEGVTVTIEGREYPIKRLNMRHTLRLGQIFSVGAAKMAGDIDFAKLDPQIMGICLLGGFLNAEHLTLAFFADILGVDAKDLLDAKRFPMGSEVLIIEALMQHVDVRALLGNLGKLAQSPAIRAFSG